MKTLLELDADKIEHDPSLLRIPLGNIDRWLANGQNAPHRLEEWRRIILRAQASPEGFQELLTLMRDRGESTEPLRNRRPFAGILTASERRLAAPKSPYHY